MAVKPIKSPLWSHLMRSTQRYVLFLDCQGSILRTNDCFAQKLGLASEALVGKSLLDYIPSAEQKPFLVALGCCTMQQQAPISLKLRHTDSNGKSFWSAWEFDYLARQEENPAGILCTASDVTELELVSRRNHEISQKIETIIENITDGFFLIDRNWRFVSVNKVFEETVNLPRAELINRFFWDLFPDSDQYHYPSAFRRALAEGVTVRFTDYRPDLKKWFSTSAYPSREGLAVYFKDITEQKLAQEQLSASEHKHRAILNSTTDSTILISPDFNILLYNKVAARYVRKFWGRSLKEGDDFRAFIMPDTEKLFYTHFQKALQGETIKLKKKLHFSNAKSIWFEFKYFPVLDKEGVLIGVSFNTTNIDKQERLFQQLDDIAMIHSHQIRRPVATLMGLASLIKEEHLDLDNRGWIQYIKETTRQLDTIIHTIVQRASNI